MLLAKLLVFALIYFIIIRPIYAAYLFTRPPRLRVAWRTPVDFAPEYEDVTLTGADGARLAGWYIPARNGAAVLLLHGHSGNRLGVMYHAQTLAEAGYGVLLLDLRRHGSSGGQTFGRGEVEREDVLTAVAYLRKRPDVNPGGIGVFGFSIGGALALHAAASTVAIRAVAVDGPSPAAMADMPPPGGVVNRFLNWPLQAAYMRLAQRFARQRPLPANLAVLPRLTQPVFFIATGQGLERQLARHFYAAVPDRKLLWEIPESAHGEGWRARPQEYGQKLAAFFDHTLLHRAAEAWVAPDWAGMETAVTPTPPSPYGEIVGDATITAAQANGIAMLLLLLTFALFGGAYWLLWRDELWRQLSNAPSLWGALLLFALAIVAHEGLHALAFLTVGRVSLTAVKFGFSWQLMAPYAHCQAPLTITAYRLAVALPGVLLGVLPGVAGLSLGSLWWTLFGVMMTIAAGGDLAVLLAVRDVPRGARVLDHPRAAGCQVLAGEGESET